RPSHSLLHTHPPTHTSTLSLHDALPILIHEDVPLQPSAEPRDQPQTDRRVRASGGEFPREPLDVLEGRRDDDHGERRDSHPPLRSEEHTSELQSRFDLVCRLLLEKKNQK